MSAQKFHINSNDEVKPCNATKRACRFMSAPHFDTESNAAAYLEKKLSAEKGGSFATSASNVSTGGTERTGEQSGVVDNNELDEGAEADSEPFKYDILAAGMQKVKKAVEKANNRLEKNGIEDRFEIVDEVYYQKINKSDTGQNLMEERAEFSVNHPSISYNGYEFQARIEQTDSGNFVAYSAPGVELKGWRPDSMNCEHCNKKINRNKVYAVKDPDGQYKIVGGNCIQLYTGMKPSNLWALDYTPTNDLEAQDFMTGMGTPVDKTDDLLSVAYVLTKDSGYKPASFGIDSTSHQVRDAFDMNTGRSGNTVYGDEERAWADSVLKEANDVDVDQIRSEVKEAIKSSDSDWAHNLRVLIDEEYSTSRGKGTVISAMAALHKYREKKNRKPWTKGFLGEKGDKIEGIKAKVVRAEEVEEHYGYYPTYAVKLTMQTEDGRKVFWKTSSQHIPEQGEDITFKATIKDTSTFKGVDSTRIVRAKWEREGNLEIDNS